MSAPARVFVALATALLTLPVLCSAAGSDTYFDRPVPAVDATAGTGLSK